MTKADDSYVMWLSDLDSDDLARVGGKNASLGEMTRNLRQAGVKVPDGFAVTSAAYRAFLDANDLQEKISAKLTGLERDETTLAKAGKAIRRMLREGDFPPAVEQTIVDAYSDLSARANKRNLDVAVRSSATAEDLPEASFAGQQETFLNIKGKKNLLQACRRCYASMFTDRAIAYREEHGFDHLKVSLSIGVQRMVRSDKSGSGVMFTLDTETGFPDTVLINAGWGLGEALVQGTINPDQYLVFKPLLDNDAFDPIIEKTLGGKARKMVYASKGRNPTRTIRTSAAERKVFVLDDAEILQLARWATDIERHYGRPMDIEWAKDGGTEELYIVQARPETVQSRREPSELKTYEIQKKGKRLVSGLSVGRSISVGQVRVLDEPEAAAKSFEDGEILVTEMTDPDWLPVMQRAAGIITDHGGRTSHAAIVSRELGLPAIVGAEDATEVLEDGQEVTVSCAEGEEGIVYKGRAEFDERAISLEGLEKTHTSVMLNIGNPGAALRWWRLPSDGVGLARMEFIINELIRIHPLALSRFDQLQDSSTQRKIEKLTTGFEQKGAYFVDTLASAIARIAASQYPNPVIVRMSDFKTNEYAQLIGGQEFEPEEENPMLGWRGASRYYSDDYLDGFALECEAIKKVRETIGFSNVIVMIPFCRTVQEADRILETLADNGLVRGEHGLEIYVMCEVPSNAILAEDFAERFDGFSIGSNDLTQLTLGVDRDSDRLAAVFDEQNEAVTSLIASVIEAAHKHRRKVGLCGQAPSDRPEFARFLVESGIDAISVTPDSFVNVKRQVATAEAAKEHTSPN